MALAIETFSNRTGPNPLFKALGHPEVVDRAQGLIDRLAAAGPIAVYDPLDQLGSFEALYDLSPLQVAGVFVQDVERVGERRMGERAQPVSDLAGAPVRTLLLAAFDARRLIDQVRHLAPAGTDILSLDELRLPEDWLTDSRRYLAPINFATNFVFFREGAGHHTRLTTANYWSAYGASAPRLRVVLFDEAGRRLAAWDEPLPGANAVITLDSAEVRRRFGLGPFTGQLFVHVVGAAGHDVVKYALDTYGDADTVLSSTHDANAFPSDLYAGLPAPRQDEKVVLWVQNSHPAPIPADGIGLRRMGEDGPATPLDGPVAGFATRPVDVGERLPGIAWPEQVEVLAGKHVVRPRYEVESAAGRRRIAHVNVERIDLSPDPRLPELGPLIGKGFILPGPVLPTGRYRTAVLPTPMATGQRHLPIRATVYDASGGEIAIHRFGNLPRAAGVALDVTGWLEEAGRVLPSGYGHVELAYDWQAGTEADGWLHAIFRHEDRETGHAAECSFGSHMFNMAVTYRNEPQSYAGRPPGLTTRLFLRLGFAGADAFCHLIYAASRPWHPHSATTLTLHDGAGRAVADRFARIPCGGSQLFRVAETFSREERHAAGEDGYVLVRDTTCRLFGYHGLIRDGASFSLDHMFGF